MMSRKTIAALILTLGASSVGGAEIRLREAARVEGAFVHLRDVADIAAPQAAEVESLGAIELFPTPSKGARRYLKIRELQDLLNERQVNLLRHQVTGASTVEIAAYKPLAAPEAKPLVGSSRQRATDVVKAAVIKHLQEQRREATPIDVQIDLDESTAKQIAAAQFQLNVEGGTAPYLGAQPLNIVLASAQQPLPIKVIAAPVPLIVVASRTLPKGTIVQRSDLTMQPIKANQAVDLESTFMKLEDVAGRESASGITAGQPIGYSMIRSPLLVRKGDAVTVISRAQGLRVRTTARAKEEGGHGDLIAVESMLNRQAFFVRVVGVQEVEVFASATNGRGEIAPPSGLQNQLHSTGVR